MTGLGVSRLAGAFGREVRGVVLSEVGDNKSHIAQPAYIYRHHWVAGDVLVWDNRCTLHTALPDGHGDGRVTFNRVAVR